MINQSDWSLFFLYVYFTYKFILCYKMFEGICNHLGYSVWQILLCTFCTVYKYLQVCTCGYCIFQHCILACLFSSPHTGDSAPWGCQFSHRDSSAPSLTLLGIMPHYQPIRRLSIQYCKSSGLIHLETFKPLPALRVALLHVNNAQHNLA